MTTAVAPTVTSVEEAKRITLVDYTLEGKAHPMRRGLTAPQKRTIPACANRTGIKNQNPTIHERKLIMPIISPPAPSRPSRADRQRSDYSLRINRLVAENEITEEVFTERLLLWYALHWRNLTVQRRDLSPEEARETMANSAASKQILRGAPSRLRAAGRITAGTYATGKLHHRLERIEFLVGFAHASVDFADLIPPMCDHVRAEWQRARREALEKKQTRWNETADRIIDTIGRGDTQTLDKLLKETYEDAIFHLVIKRLAGVTA